MNILGEYVGSLAHGENEEHGRNYDYAGSIEDSGSLFGEGYNH